MKNLLPVLLFGLTAALCTAQESFPGLKQVMTKAEWERAGMDRLTPDEIGVIEAAFIRFNVRSTTQLQAQLTTARQQATQVAATEQPSVSSISAPGAVTPPKGWLERFGLPIGDSDWRSLPPLKARVKKWDGGNRFVLENGQVWEGFQPITYELVGKEIEIQARPHGQFALVVEGLNTTLRVMRLR